MSKVGWEARVGAFAFMVGLSWVGLQTAGLASADDGAGSSSPSASTGHAKPGGGVARQFGHAAPAPRAAAKPSAVGARQIPLLGSPRVGAKRPAPTAQAAVPTQSDPIVSAPIAARPAASASANPVQSFVDHLPLQIRRTFFNNAPTVQPVQITGQHDGVISGTIGAVDPEGDVIKYKVVAAGAGAPLHGTVHVASDGTFTYTPGSDFTGTDEFAVRATDVGPHINLLNLFRSPSTTASVTVNQYVIGTPALKFAFTFDSGSESWWTPASRAALQAAGDFLASRIVPSASLPVTVSYLITVQSTPGSSLLGTGSSSLAIVGGGKFEDTVVQHKILTGIDQNGTQADGTIVFNSAHTWSFDSTPNFLETDFETVALHELVHTLGFLSTVGSASSSTYRTKLDGFATTSTGIPLFLSNGSWATTRGGSVYFDGPNATAAYGRLVPLDATGAHLNGSTFAASLMSPSIGTGVRRIKLSAVEIGMLEDIGYTVIA
ncbi:Ig-like domain-containing protein [Mycobacterium sp. SA01]|uniref:Ig-like domain-containing protein n=1 Tax=Mycobacterium sp. SA01 TaxID=3238820 RepID=UPI00351BE98A